MRDIAKELEDIVKAAAGDIPPGYSVQKQINLACKNLGYPRGHWRVRAAWYGAAANWQSKAVFDLIDRYHKYLAVKAAFAEADNLQRQVYATGPR